jgi:DNA-directed RNA polymerase specialized sigma24 family protein
VAPLPGDDIRTLIEAIADGNDEAWAAFVERFAPVIMQAARFIERDADAAGDAFVHACQSLRDHGGKRLGAFDFSRPGHFDTWLRAGAINLCRDARRRRLGRFRPLAALRRLPPLEQRLFRLRHELGYTFEQALAALTPEFPGLTERTLLAADEAVAAQMNARERWVLLTRRPRLDSLSTDADGDGDREVPNRDDDLDPEWQVLAREASHRLNSALDALEPGDRLLVLMRYRKGVTLKRLTTIFGFRDVQTTDRRTRSVLKRLRAYLE